MNLHVFLHVCIQAVLALICVQPSRATTPMAGQRRTDQRYRKRKHFSGLFFLGPRATGEELERVVATECPSQAERFCAFVAISRKRTCYDKEVYLFLAKMFSERRGSLTQNRRKIRPISFCVILVVYLGHGIFPLGSRFKLLLVSF